MPTVIETWPAETDSPDPHEGPLYLDAEIAPNRSLPNPAFIALMVAITAISFTAGLLFFTMGAWPVAPFFGLDALLVWLAFRISYRDGRAREWVKVNARDIEVTRRHPTGHLRRFRMPTAWAQFRHIDAGQHHSQVAVSVSGKSLVLASTLSPKERSEFAKALDNALQQARAGTQEAGGFASPET